MAVYNFNTALLRAPAKSVARGLRAVGGEDPNFDSIASEHQSYVAALRTAGVEPIVLPALEDFPDSIFVEDPALVFPEGAILLRPGAPSRRGEADEIAPVLYENFDTVLSLPEGGTVEGGDILTTPDKVMIGHSARTNQAGAKALQRLLTELGRKSEIVTTPEDVLHFKSDCSLLDEETILATERLAQSGVFHGFDVIKVPSGEEAAANALRINDIVMVNNRHPRTIDLLDQRQYKIEPIKTDQIAIIDAGLSCMSLRWQSTAN